MNLSTSTLLALVTLAQATHDTVTITETKTIATCAESCYSTVTVNICTSVPGTVSLPFTKLTTSTTEATARPVPTESCTSPNGCDEYPAPSSVRTEDTVYPVPASSSSSSSSSCSDGYGCESTTKVTRRVTQTDTVTFTRSYSHSRSTLPAENTYPTPGYPSMSESYPVESSMQAETTGYETVPTYNPPSSTEETVRTVTQSYSTPEKPYPVTTSHVPCGPSSDCHPTYPMPNGTHPLSDHTLWNSGTAPGTTQKTAEPIGFTTSSAATYPEPTYSNPEEDTLQPTYSSPEETCPVPASAESTTEASSYSAPTTSTDDEYYPPPPAESTSADNGYYPPAPSTSDTTLTDKDYPLPTGGGWPTSTIAISAESTVDAVHPSSSLGQSYTPPPATTMVTSSKRASTSDEGYYPPPPVTYDLPPSYQY